MTRIKSFEIKPNCITAALTGIAVALIVGGFFCPPIGEIDGSVLTAVGELFAFAALWTTIFSIMRGADVTIRHGQTDVTINNEEDKDGENN